jgi:hypothetical protein
MARGGLGVDKDLMESFEGHDKRTFMGKLIDYLLDKCNGLF